jgi:hypothetical protein
MGLCLWPCDGPRGGTFSYEQGAPVHVLNPRSTHTFFADLNDLRTAPPRSCGPYQFKNRARPFSVDLNYVRSAHNVLIEYMGTSLIRKRLSLGPYGRPTPGTL